MNARIATRVELSAEIGCVAFVKDTFQNEQGEIDFGFMGLISHSIWIQAHITKEIGLIAVTRCGKRHERSIQIWYCDHLLLHEGPMIHALVCFK